MTRQTLRDMDPDDPVVAAVSAWADLVEQSRDPSLPVSDVEARIDPLVSEIEDRLAELTPITPPALEALAAFLILFGQTHAGARLVDVLPQVTALHRGARVFANRWDPEATAPALA